jgi:hypothetical protein
MFFQKTLTFNSSLSKYFSKLSLQAGWTNGDDALGVVEWTDDDKKTQYM